ncbi:MAG: hypothetical protein U9O87_06955 [Verrucomicrobiota bacterium]|nr:hypothetical protein [Verrucomicrobiota bacterium]
MDILGFILAFLSFVYMGILNSDCKKGLARIDAKYQIDNKKLVELANIKTENNIEKQKAIKQRAEEMNKKATDLINEHRKLEKELAELHKKKENLDAELLQVKKSMKNLQEVASLTQDGLKDLKDMSNNLLKKKREAIATYKRRFTQLDKKYMSILSNMRESGIKGFALRYKHTPFGPCALFAFAEFNYKTGTARRAAAPYKQLIKIYPDSKYVAYAQAQLNRIRQRKRFEPSDAPQKIYYKALQLH